MQNGKWNIEKVRTFEMERRKLNLEIEVIKLMPKCGKTYAKGSNNNKTLAT